jgi:hypothetical protein
MKLIWMVYLALLTSLSLFSGDIQGEKIVLHSFATFDEAQSKLKELESKITPNDIELRNTHHFDFVARKSGRAYIIVIEPIKTVNEATAILEHFKKTFPNAYTDHYYGPTQGEIKISFASPKIAPKVPRAPKTTEISVEEESKSSGGYGWLWVPALLLIIVGSLVFVWKGLGSRKEAFDDSDLIRDDEIITLTEETNPYASKDSPTISPKKEVLDHTDIFYRFTQNIFFTAILRELKEACDAQDAQEVVRCMGEIEKYQKNFRRSSVIATMSRLVNKEGFAQLSQLIEKEMK